MGELKKEMQHWVQETIHKAVSSLLVDRGSGARLLADSPPAQKATDLAEQ